MLDVFVPSLDSQIGAKRGWEINRRNSTLNYFPIDNVCIIYIYISKNVIEMRKKKNEIPVKVRKEIRVDKWKEIHTLTLGKNPFNF